MKYKSTRSTLETSASQAILNGLADDGGLYVPTTIPKITLSSCKDKTYQEIALIILAAYFDDIQDSLTDAVNAAYSSDNFTHPLITGLTSIDDQTTLLELFHGKTSAFKDQALSVYPYLLKAAMNNHDINHLTILAATSGDTGKAAMEALSDIEGLSIAVLYPHGMTSPIQALQMKTQSGSNVFPLAINGNFDVAQTAVKDFFLKHPEANVSSANSINIARLLPQIIYYYDAFVRMEVTNPIDVYVPTGNFGNVLAAYLAKEMGLPIRRLVVCTNENKVLYDFFTTGVYDIRNRDFVLTPSPSMDILISSNLERLLYFVIKDEQKIAKMMDDLKNNLYFAIDSSDLSKLQTSFATQVTTNIETENVIASVFSNHNILIDPHTATAIPQNSNSHHRLVVSTASPYKFPEIYRSIFKISTNDIFTILDTLEERSNAVFPSSLKTLRDKEVRFNTVLNPGEIEEALIQFITSEEKS